MIHFETRIWQHEESSKYLPIFSNIWCFFSLYTLKLLLWYWWNLNQIPVCRLFLQSGKSKQKYWAVLFILSIAFGQSSVSDDPTTAPPGDTSGTSQSFTEITDSVLWARGFDTFAAQVIVEGRLYSIILQNFVISVLEEITMIRKCGGERFWKLFKKLFVELCLKCFYPFPDLS